MINLMGARVLFVSPRFFGYEQDVGAELASRGAKVDFLPDRPFETPIMKAVTRFRREWMISAADRLYRRMLTEFGRSAYDLILVVNGQTLSTRILREMRSAFPTARLVLYMWDSIENRRAVANNLGIFDACYTFDPGAASAHGMTFRPLFFSRGFERPPTDEADYDVSFIGTAHTDRYRIIRDMDQSLPSDVRRYWYLYLQAPWVFYTYKAINPSYKRAKISDISFDPLAKASVQQVFFNSKAVLDIEHPNQSGLTMRTFETLGSSRKLITTNVRIADYDLYDPQNIHIIDRRNAVVPVEFLRSPYAPPSPPLYDRYRLSTWLDDILGG